MSIVLLLGALYGVMRAVMLCCIPVNRHANRFLAALIVVLALFTFPYIIGYAGYYDAYPWLSYFPYKLSLAIGPLLYCYASCLSGATVPRWRWHLAPALLQLAYYCVIFAQPLAFKNQWDGSVHVPLLDPVETLATLVSLCAYWIAAYRTVRACNAASAPLREWARNVLIACGLTIVFWMAMSGAEVAVEGLSYFHRFPFYLWLVVCIGYLGTEGYRQGALTLPATVLPPPAAEPAAPPPSYTELGERWRATVQAEGWWRDPELSLATLAARLGTNTTTLSRAMNEGLGLNFNEMINRMRVDAVVTALQQAPEDASVLDIALSEGFNSKASFNRAFKLYTGETPTEYRRRAGVASSDDVPDPTFHS